MSKGEDTRNAILRMAFELSAEVGLEGLTIGTLAKRAGLSKSGLYAHFESKTDLQCCVLNAAADFFTELVLKPAFAEPRGLPRLRSLFDHWLAWGADELAGGCPFIAAAPEFDDRPGPVRDVLASHVEAMFAILGRATRLAVDEGHLREDLDTDQFAYETWSLLLGHHYCRRLLHHDAALDRTQRAFDGLIAAAKTPRTEPGAS